MINWLKSKKSLCLKIKELNAVIDECKLKIIYRVPQEKFREDATLPALIYTLVDYYKTEIRRRNANIHVADMNNFDFFYDRFKSKITWRVHKEYREEYNNLDAKYEETKPKYEESKADQEETKTKYKTLLKKLALLELENLSLRNTINDLRNH